MKIAIIQGAFFPVPPLRGGAVEKIWHPMAIEFAARGHEVWHISRSFPSLPIEETRQGVFHRRTDGYDQPLNGMLLKWYDLLYSRRACRAIPSGVDVVVTNTFWSPLILRRHRGVYVNVDRMPKGQMRLYRGAARLRASSSVVAHAIRSEVGNQDSRVAIIPNPLPNLPPREPEWRAKERIILFVGRLHPEKGIELLLQAFRRAKADARFADWRLELVGPADAAGGGGGSVWFEKLQREYHRPDIVWRGAVYDPAELARYFERAAVFVYPSLAEKGETFGVAVLEAMAWGAVPIVSQLECFTDFMRAGVHGFTFDHRAADPVEALADAMLAATAAELRQFASRAVSVRQTHSVARIAAEFLSDFQTLVDGQGQPH
jgi:glycosyltransferase involved in cell wall biosynthesis